MYFILYSNCKIVNGYRQSLLYDLHRHSILNIPKPLAELLLKHDFKINIPQLDESIKEIVTEFCDRMIDSGVGFYYDQPDEFIEIPMEYDTPAIIDHVIISCDHKNNYSDLLVEITSLGSETLSLVFNNGKGFIECAEQLLRHAKNSSVTYTEIHINFDLLKDPVPDKEIERLHELNKTFRRIIVHLEEDTDVNEKTIGGVKQYFIKKQLNKKGYNAILNFAINLPVFCEAQQFNTYYNKKIFVNEKLEITPALLPEAYNLSMPKSTKSGIEV